MVTFNTQYKRAATKLVLIYILNIMDLIFTMFLVKTRRYAEANPLLNPIITNPAFIVHVKIILVGLLIAWVLTRMKKATSMQLVLSNRIIGLLAGLYLVVDSMHVFWILREI